MASAATAASAAMRACQARPMGVSNTIAAIEARSTSMIGTPDIDAVIASMPPTESRTATSVNSKKWRADGPQAPFRVAYNANSGQPNNSVKLA